MRQWLAVRPKTDHPFLFVTDRRRRLGDDGLRKLLEAARSLADLRDHVHITPHALGHAAATRMQRNGADLRSIQVFLGHSLLATTTEYIHSDEHQLRRIAELGEFQGSKTADDRREPGTRGTTGDRGQQKYRLIRRPSRRRYR